MLIFLLLATFTTTLSQFFYRNDIKLNEFVDINEFVGIDSALQVNEIGVNTALQVNEIGVNKELSFCVYDGINVTLSLGFNTGSFNTGSNGNSLFGLMSSLALAFKRTDRPLFVLTLLENIINTENSCVTTDDGIDYIECNESSSLNCQVYVDQISVTKFDAGGKITLTFNQETNSPALLSSNSVHSALSFSPPVLGSIIGEWDEADSKLLYLYIDYAYYMSILKSYEVDATSIKVNVRKSFAKENIKICPNNTINTPNTIVGSKIFKSLEFGLYDIHLVDMISMRIVKNITQKRVQIKPCNDVLFLPTFQGDSMNSTDLPGILYRMKGIVAIGPLITSLMIPYSIAESLHTHEWSLSFWILCLENPNGNFRTLFFKGNGNTNEKTPSAWLNQHNNKIIFRLSSANSKDEGVETTSEVITGAWTHIAVTFQAVTTTSYTVCIYMNGKLDVKFKSNEGVKYNNDTFMLFKDPSHAGPAGYFKDLILWNNMLPDDHVMSLYSSTLLTPAVNDKQSMDAIEISKGIFKSINSMNRLSEHPLLLSDVEPLTDELQGLENTKYIDSLIVRARQESLDCDAYDSLYDIYTEASAAGSVEALYKQAMMITFGFDDANSNCGHSKYSFSPRQPAAPSDYIKAFKSFIVAAEHGYTDALVPLSFYVMNGIIDFNAGFYGVYNSTNIPFSSNKLQKSSLFDRIFHYINSISSDDEIVSSSKHSAAIGDNVYCSGMLPLNKSKCQRINHIGIGLLFTAALYGNAQATASLAVKYDTGINTIQDAETALAYSFHSSKVAFDNYHTLGHQPYQQEDKIDDNTELFIEKGNLGESDELITYEKIKADEGDIQAMLTTAFLFYFGARGVMRNQPLALDYYDMAARAGNVDGMCGAANMFLKGEGGPKNITKAIEYYENAINKSENGVNVKAQNGLGYIYFYGNDEIEKNVTKAYEYFLASANLGVESDSIFNAAFCLENGYGVEKDVFRALQLYITCANKFNHFDCSISAGRLIFNGVYSNGSIVYHRNPLLALTYQFNALKNGGSWSAWTRRGLDQYLYNQHTKSLLCYLFIGELAYKTSLSNVGFIIKRKLTNIQLPEHNNLLLLHIRVLDLLIYLGDETAESLLQLAHIYFHGAGREKNLNKALYYYSLAGSKGNKLANVYAGVMNHFGLGCDKNEIRAIRYYNTSLNNPQTHSPITSQIQYLVKSLIWMAENPSSNNLLSYPVSVVIKMLW